MSQGYQQPHMPASPGNGLAIASLVLGLLGLILAVTTGWIPCIGVVLPIIPTLLATIFGFVGKGRANQGAPYGGVAIAGLACGLIGLLLTIGFQIFWGAAATKVVQDAGGIQGLQKMGEDVQKQFQAEMQKAEEASRKMEIEIEIDGAAKKEKNEDAHAPATKDQPGTEPQEPAKDSPSEKKDNPQ